jgi:hypothetical protein
MTRTIALAGSVVAAALVFSAPAQAQSPDAFERAVAARASLQSSPIVSPDAFDRAVAARQSLQSSPIVSPDAVDRVRQATLALQSTPIQPPDAFERALTAQSFVSPSSASDGTSTVAAPEIVPSSGDEIEWSQVAAGFGIGISLMLTLVLGLRLVRMRSLAH